MGWYTAQNNAKVNKLVLYAPQWIRNTAALTEQRWRTGVPAFNQRGSALGCGPAQRHVDWSQQRGDRSPL